MNHLLAHKLDRKPSPSAGLEGMSVESKGSVPVRDLLTYEVVPVLWEPVDHRPKAECHRVEIRVCEGHRIVDLAVRSYLACLTPTIKTRGIYVRTIA